jgi:hypothetical protein
MEKHAKQFHNEILKAQQILTDRELYRASMTFPAGILAYLELSEDGKITFEQIMDSMRLAIGVQLERRNENSN